MAEFLVKAWIIVAGAGVSWFYISSVMKNPIPMLRISLGVIVFIIVFFGLFILFATYFPNSGTFFNLVTWIGSAFAACYVAKPVIGSDEDHPKS